MVRVVSRFALIFLVGLAVAGCSGSPLLDRDAYHRLFTKKVNLFRTPEWAKASPSANGVQLNPKGPVPPEDLVSADGRCAPKVAAAPASPPPAAASAPEPQPAKPATLAAAEANRPVGSVAGDLAGAPMPTASHRIAATTGSAPPPDRLVPEGSGGGGATPATPALLGGVALGMTECQVVRRAGAPSNVSIGGGKVRNVVLSYFGGDWPGIYHFRAGRLKEVDATPAQLQADAKAKAKRAARGRAARRAVRRRGTDSYYVQ